MDGVNTQTFAGFGEGPSDGFKLAMNVQQSICVSINRSQPSDARYRIHDPGCNKTAIEIVHLESCILDPASGTRIYLLLLVLPR